MTSVSFGHTEHCNWRGYWTRYLSIEIESLQLEPRKSVAKIGHVSGLSENLSHLISMMKIIVEGRKKEKPMSASV